MNDIIYLEPEDEITSVVDRLKASSAPGVVLALPRGSSLAQSIVNLKILKRSAEEIGREIFLVTSDRIARNLASQIGITVFTKVVEAERARLKTESKVEVGNQGGSFRINTYNRSQSDYSSGSPPSVQTVSDNSLERPSLSEPRNEKDKETMNEKRKDVGKAGSKRSFLTFFLIMLIITGILLYLFLPSAKASLELKTEDYSSALNITIDRDGAFDAGKLVIPGKLFEAEKEIKKNFAASGKKEIGETAKGRVEVVNSYDSNSHKYPKGARFISNAKTFLADEAFSVSGASVSLAAVQPGSGTVNVTAEKAGESYNLPAANYALEGAPAQIYGKGGQMSGGVTREVKFVTEEDLTSAQESLRVEAQSASQAEVKSGAKVEKYELVESASTTEILSFESSKKAEEEAENFDLSLKAKTFGLGFLESDLRQAISTAAEGEIGPDKMILNPEQLEVKYEIVENNRDLNSLKIKTTIRGRAAKKISTQEIQALIRNKSAAAAKAALEGIDEVENARVTTWPGFMRRTPLIVNRIEVEFGYVSGN